MENFEKFDPVFGEPKLECVNSESASQNRFLFHVYASDSSHLTFHVTDFRSNSWEAIRSVSQLDDMRDTIGIGGSWSEFMDYVVASIKSEDVKLVLEGISDSNRGAVSAKLIAQKAKGMPRISITLRKIGDSAASEGMANLSLDLFKELKSIKEQVRSSQLTEVMPEGKEKCENIKGQVEQHTERQKLRKLNSLEKADASITKLTNGRSSPDKQTTRDAGAKKVTNRVVPAFRRAKVRGALLSHSEDDQDN